MMRIKPLSQGDKDAVTALARSLSMRALLSGEQAGADASFTQSSAVADQLADFDRRLERISREAQAHATRTAHALEILQRRVAGLAGDFEAMRLTLVEMESRLEQSKDIMDTSMSHLVNGLTVEVARELDRLALVTEDTALVQQEMARLARQVIESGQGD